MGVGGFLNHVFSQSILLYLVVGWLLLLGEGDGKQ
jgi:hypothetical protein